MTAYDPKRPRPSSTTDPDEAPPVDALLDPAPGSGSGPGSDDTVAADDTVASDETVAADETVTADGTVAEVVAPEFRPTPAPDEVDLRAATSANGNGSRPAQKRAAEVPIARAPEEGTTNRAVLIAALVSTSVLAVVVALLVRRRRHRGG